MTTHRRPPETHEFELIVAGGGLAGVCAAIAAARGGVKTAIIQDRPVFGGNSSSEIRVVPYGAAQGSAWTGETGIVHELILEDRQANHEHFFDHGLMNSLYDMVLAEGVRREPNLTAFLNTSVRGVDTEPVEDGAYTRRITAIHASQLASEKEFIFRAPQFIDVTGDGTVGYLAGAEYRYGREARSEFGEPLAPVVADDVTLGSTITMRARKIDRPAPYSPPPWIAEYKTLAEIGLDRTLYHIKKDTFGGYWWLEVGNPYHQIDDNAAIRDELHRHVLGVWNYIKNHSPDKEEAANYVLDWIGQIPGKREARRLVGDVTVTEHDCHTPRGWPDGVAYAAWWIDLHIKGGILNKEEPGERENIDDRYKHWIRVEPFDLPLRAFYSRNVQNLWMAGRLLSVSHVALGPVRVQLSLAVAGQAVGAAAAYAARRGLTPRQAADPQGEHIAAIRQGLLRDDIHVLGLRNGDPADLALGARVSATSELPLDFGEPAPERWSPLTRDLGQVLPVTHERVERAELYLKNDGDAPAVVPVELHELERCWGRLTGKVVARTRITLPPHWEGWATGEFQITASAGRPHRVALRQTPGVSWAQTAQIPVGTGAQYLYVSPGGPEPKNAHLPSFGPAEIDLPAYAHWRQLRKFSLAVRLTPQPLPFGPANVTNGCAWPEDMPNLWISHPGQELPQSVELRFAAPATFDTALVTFDTNLDRRTDQMPPFYRAPECVRDWRLLACVDGAWVNVYEERGNYQRRREACFPAVTATALRLEALATNGDRSARVYEIRVYRSDRG